MAFFLSTKLLIGFLNAYKFDFLPISFFIWLIFRVRIFKLLDFLQIGQNSGHIGILRQINLPSGLGS